VINGMQTSARTLATQVHVRREVANSLTDIKPASCEQTPLLPRMRVVTFRVTKTTTKLGVTMLTRMTSKSSLEMRSPFLWTKISLNSHDSSLLHTNYLAWISFQGAVKVLIPESLDAPKILSLNPRLPND
jgi:hypothetical protein